MDRKYNEVSPGQFIKKDKSSISLKIKMGLFAAATITGAYIALDKLSSNDVNLNNIDFSKTPALGTVVNDFTAIKNHNQNSLSKDTCDFSVGDEVIIYNTDTAWDQENNEVTVDLMETKEEGCRAWAYRRQIKENVDNIRIIDKDYFDSLVNSDN